MKISKSKKILTLFLAIVFIINLSLPIGASSTTEPPLFGGNLIWNITSIYYYLDSSASSLATPVANAANNWVYTGYGWNNLYPNTRTYNISNSAIDIYGYTATDGNNGYTTFLARTNVTSGSAYSVAPATQNWLFNEIKLNLKYLSTASSTYKQGVVAHEMGHCFGLNENNSNPYSIMCQTSHSRAVYTVQQVDQNAFNRKHP